MVVEGNAEFSNVLFEGDTIFSGNVDVIGIITAANIVATDFSVSGTFTADSIAATNMTISNLLTSSNIVADAITATNMTISNLLTSSNIVTDTITTDVLQSNANGDILISGNVFVSGIISGNGLLTQYNTYNIAKEGGDYSTVKDAIAALPETNSTNRWNLIMYPGIYIEDNPIQMKNYTSLVSIGGPITTIIQPQNSNAYVISLAPRTSNIKGVHIRNCLHTGIRCSDVLYAATVESVYFSNVKHCISLNSPNTNVDVFCQDIALRQGECTQAIRCLSGHIHINGIKIDNRATVESVFYSSGNAAILHVSSIEIEGDGVEHAVHASNGGHITALSGLIHGSNIGYYIDDNDYFGLETAHIDMRNVELVNTRNYDIRVESISADIQCHNSGISRDKAFVLPGANCMIVGFDSFSNQYRMCASTSIGRDGSGHDFNVGEGGEYTFNTRVLTYDGASYVDVTTSDGITFPNLNANTAIYFGDLDAYSFYAVQYTMGSQIQVLGGATCLWEYYDASIGAGFPGLVLYYTMNSDSATNTVVDNAGSYSGVASQLTSTLHTAGKVGTGAFAFISTRGDIISTLPRPTNIDTISIAVWINTSTSNQTFIALRRNRRRYVYRLGINSSGYAYFYINTSAGKATETNTGTLINNGAWHFLVATYDANGGANNLQVYVDNGAPSQATHTGTIDSSSYPIETGRNYTGSLDNLMIYSTAIDAALANTLWNGGAGTESATTPGWVQMDGMNSLLGTSYIQFNNYFEGTSTQKYNIRYDQHIETGSHWSAGTTGWIGTTIDGLPGKWIRYRINGAGMTTSPIFSDIKFKGNYIHFRPNGTIAYYGKAREQLCMNIQPYNNINTTADQTMDVSTNITIPFVQNSFADGAQDSLYFVIPIQTGTDTSCGIEIKLNWFTDDTHAVDDYIAKMHIYYSKVREGDLCNAGSNTETIIDFDCNYIAPAAAGALFKTDVPTYMYIDNLERGDQIYCMLRREVDEAGDTLVGYLSVTSLSYSYNVWEHGTYYASVSA